MDKEKLNKKIIVNNKAIPDNKSNNTLQDKKN
jgi:hypothetical protein